MTLKTENLDAEELLHLALKATQSNQTEDGIQYLKRALILSPENANILYLLGALHAEIGLYQRAIEEIKHAVIVDPTLNAAHFQLGLLYLTSGDLENAKQSWIALDTLGEENEFYLFKTGMLHLANDEFEECIEYLEKGLKVPHNNLALNKDMQKMIDKAKAALDQNVSGDNDKGDEKPGEDIKSAGNKLLLSAYEKPDDGDIH